MQKLIVILGPTASGKTALASHLASVFDGEIINADSRQLYKFMDIGTAKPDYANSTIACHLFDIVEPDQEFSIAHYKTLAINTMEEIIARQKLPFLVGGSGLYIKAVVENLDIPAVPAQKKLRGKLEKKSKGELYKMLEELDPVSAQKIDKDNTRRLVRALEVIAKSGKPLSSRIKKGPSLYKILQLGLKVPQEVLFRNIEERTQEMIESGLEEEVKFLVSQYGWNPLLLSTIGYKEWREYLEDSKTISQACQEISKNTKNLVKKQMTWFKAQRGIFWIKNKKEAEKLVENFLKS